MRWFFLSFAGQSSKPPDRRETFPDLGNMTQIPSQQADIDVTNDNPPLSKTFLDSGSAPLLPTVPLPPMIRQPLHIQPNPPPTPARPRGVFSIENLLSKGDDPEDEEEDIDVDDDEDEEEEVQPFPGLLKPTPISADRPASPSSGAAFPGGEGGGLMSSPAAAAAAAQEHQQHLIYSQWLASRNSSIFFGLQGTRY